MKRIRACVGTERVQKQYMYKNLCPYSLKFVDVDLVVNVDLS